MRRFPSATRLVAALALVAAATGASAADRPENVVYHVDDMATAREALSNVENHLAASPRAHIVVLANGKGIYLVVANEGDRSGEYAQTISRLQSRGVQFEACHNSLDSRHIAETSVLAGVKIIPAGVVELARLQLDEHYAYIKP